MKITPLVMITALVFAIIIGATIGIFNKLEGNVLFEDQAYRQLLSIAESKADRIEDFLDNRKSDALFLSTYEDVRDIFDEELFYDVDLMAEKIRNIAEKARDEIELYLLVHPEMTIEDLQEDEAFESIAVQRVGDTGYTFVYDYDTMINKFHLRDTFRGINYTSLKDESGREAWWELMEPTQYGRNELGGFVLWEEPDGSFREKYKHTSIVSVKTADGVGLAIGATTYVDEYSGSVQLASDLDRNFKSFQEKKGYSDLIFIGIEGDVVWTAKRNNELGTNLVTGVYNESFLANVFNKAKKDLSVGISDFEVYDAGDKLNIFITAPVMDFDEATGEKVLVGIIALKLDNDNIEGLITTDVGLGDSGEVYIVDRHRHHITPLKFDKHENDASEYSDGEFHEDVTSEGIENCFKDYNNYYFELRGESVEVVAKTSRYLNYAESPDVVLGAYDYILESGWCVIVEMSEDYFIEITPQLNKTMMIIIGSLFLIIFILSLVLDGLFEIRRTK